MWSLSNWFFLWLMFAKISLTISGMCQLVVIIHFIYNVFCVYTDCNGCSAGGTDGGVNCYDLSNDIYACRGIFSGGMEDESTTSICNTNDGFHICQDAIEAVYHGLTYSDCTNSISPDEIYFMQETSAGNALCYSSYPSTGNKTTGPRGDIWGCGGSNLCSISSCYGVSDVFCSNYDDTGNGLDLGTDSENEYDYVSITNASIGGVMCCPGITLSPTFPTSVPSKIPTSIPTGQPSDTTYIPYGSLIGKNSTTTESMPTNQGIGGNNYKEDLVEITWLWEAASYICLGVSLIVPCILSIIVLIFHRRKKFYGCDKPNYLAIFSFFWNFGDFYSDIIFGFVLLFQRNKLWYFAAIFALVPYVIGAVILLKHIDKWNNSSFYISYYIQRFDAFLIGVTIISGFYTSIELARSKIFYLDRFYLALNHRDYTSVQRFRFFNIVLLEYVDFFLRLNNTK